MQQVHRLLVTATALAWLAGAGASTGDSAATEREIACVRLDNRIAELRLNLRQGYTAKQGRTYRQKLAGLEAEKRARCRRS
ncbi:MAG: hypothetical protein ABI661_08630 [Gammaproteobacteria bacterium]